MEDKDNFEIIYLEDAMAFLKSLPEKVQDKFYYTITKSKKIIDKELFKKLEGTDIWEFRVRYLKMAYRLFAFWDLGEDRLVIATHGFVKKTQKTPKKEIDRAAAMMKAYFKSKERKNEDGRD